MANQIPAEVPATCIGKYKEMINKMEEREFQLSVAKVAKDGHRRSVNAYDVCMLKKMTELKRVDAHRYRLPYDAKNRIWQFLGQEASGNMSRVRSVQLLKTHFL